jgi:hypothetical protein
LNQGDVIAQINGRTLGAIAAEGGYDAGGLTQKDLAGIIRSATRPMRMTFIRQPLTDYDPVEMERQRVAAHTPEAIAAREEATRHREQKAREDEAQRARDWKVKEDEYETSKAEKEARRLDRARRAVLEERARLQEEQEVFARMVAKEGGKDTNDWKAERFF